jgi:glycogen operon protein
VRSAVRLWRAQPVLQRRHFFQGRSIRGSGVSDISWIAPDGAEMTDAAWGAGYVKCLGMRLAGDRIGQEDERGRPIVGDTLLVLLNAHWEPISFALPVHESSQRWELVLDTARHLTAPEPWPEGRPYDLTDRSLAVFRIRAPEGPAQIISPKQAEELLDPRSGPTVPSGS